MCYNPAMPARKPPPLDEKPQRERFIDTARQIGASEDPAEFERAFKAVMRSKEESKEGPAVGRSRRNAKRVSS
jgi:hypothetical protein